MSFIQKTIRALWVKTHPLTKMVRALPALLRRDFPREADVWTPSEIRETYKKLNWKPKHKLKDWIWERFQ